MIPFIIILCNTLCAAWHIEWMNEKWWFRIEMRKIPSENLIILTKKVFIDVLYAFIVIILVYFTSNNRFNCPLFCYFMEFLCLEVNQIILYWNCTLGFRIDFMVSSPNTAGDFRFQFQNACNSRIILRNRWCHLRFEIENCKRRRQFSSLVILILHSMICKPNFSANWSHLPTGIVFDFELESAFDATNSLNHSMPNENRLTWRFTDFSQ